MKLTSSQVAVAGTHASTSALVQDAAAPAAAGSRMLEADVRVGAQAAQVQQASAALGAMPQVDAARVAEIKAALARGEIGFDPKKLAGLIVRHHGGQG